MTWRVWLTEAAGQKAVWWKESGRFLVPLGNQLLVQPKELEHSLKRISPRDRWKIVVDFAKIEWRVRCGRGREARGRIILTDADGHDSSQYY